MNQSHKPYIDLLKVEEGTPKSNTRNAIQGSFYWYWVNRIEYWRNQKPEVQKMLICSKSRESTPEYRGGSRFSNTSVDVQQIIVTNERNGKYCKQTCEIESGIKSCALWQSAQSF